jgi:hypothetical protein
MPKTQEDQVADFSDFYKKNQPAGLGGQGANSPKAKPPADPKRRRLMILIIIFIALAAIQAGLYLYNKSQRPPAVPEGYQLVSPDGQPAQIIPVK